VGLDAAFFPALWALAEKTRVRPEVLLAVWWFETGGTLEPSTRNAYGCIGLNQSCPKSIGGPGFPVDASVYQAWPASAQLAWIAPQLEGAIARGGGEPFRSAARYMQGNMLPASLPIARGVRDAICGRAGPFPGAYEPNAGLDFTGDGRITLEDIGDTFADAIRARGANLRAAIARAYAERPADAPWSGPLDVFDAVYEPGSTRHLARPARVARGRRSGPIVAFFAFAAGGILLTRLRRRHA
jgi:hypothetical protein